MLKKRIVATLIIRDGIVVQSIKFRTYMPVGKPEIAIEFLNSWGVDEIIVVDVSASRDHMLKNFGLIEQITRSCFVPVTVGGGINSIDDIHLLMRYGADKVSINSHPLLEPGFISEAAHVFGNQCVVVSIDVVGSAPGTYRVYNAARRNVVDLSPVEWAKKAEALGAGEIYLTSVDRDGTKKGFDLALLDMVSSAVRIPVIASGGAGNAGHILEAFNKTNVSAVSAANCFHFSEHSVIIAKAVLSNSEIDIRLNTHANYRKCVFDEDFRLKKQDDTYLQNLLFEKIESEVI